MNVQQYFGIIPGGMKPIDNSKQRIRRLYAFGAALFAAALGLAVAGWYWSSDNREDRLYSKENHSQEAVAALVPPETLPQIYKPLTPDDALAENATLPFSTAPIERAPPLVIPLTASAFAGRRSAMDCLTAAVYYEAAQESETGRRGVAQVILNRARHPAFPDSICGVVYQGSERKTGCQFTFTCDGSLARRPSRAGWDAARRVAISALSGFVEPSVGMATHYHADYVVPYWAPSLAKIAKVDRHIFYRWSGGWGRRAAFNQSVRQEQFFNDEPQIGGLAQLDVDVTVPSAYSGARPLESRLVADKTAGALTGRDALILPRTAAVPSIRADETPAKPAADSVRGSLKLD